jgi:penicillin-binding protein 2
MNFHPNDVQRRARVASGILFLTIVFLTGSFFRAQVLQHSQYALASEKNRLREVPIPAPRGQIYDRTGAIIAENIPGYTVSLLSPGEDSLRAALGRLSSTIQMTPKDVDDVVKRFRRNPNRPAVIFGDASFDLVSVLEEHRVAFPGLIIQAAPKRYYPDGPAVAALVGYTGEISERELGQTSYAGYKSGQQVGKEGIEKQYESRLRGQEGVRFVEVDVRGRVVREAGAREDLNAQAAPPLYTNIDLDLQKFIVQIFGDSLQGAAVALEPKSGEVLALYSAPSYDPNRFVGGVRAAYYDSLLADKRRPLYNKAIQGAYPPGSTWKLASAITALEDSVATLEDHMPIPCTGGMQYGNRWFKCDGGKGHHGSLTLAQAIEQSCDVYFYQLGLKIGISRLVAGGISLGSAEKSGIDLPNETKPSFPTAPAIEYYNKRYGVRGWSTAVSLSVAIGQGENAQTVVNMARFYTAIATDGQAAHPQVVRGSSDKERLFTLDSAQMAGIRAALAGVVLRGTAAGARIEGLTLAGKTGTAQNGRIEEHKPDHSWFVGFAPADNPKIVVAMMIENGGWGARSAPIAAKIIEHYLKAKPKQLLHTEGN